MGKFILSCADEVDDMDDAFGVWIEVEDKEGTKYASFRMVCERCKDEYSKLGILIDVEE